jgi:hypothetical protein
MRETAVESQASAPARWPATALTGCVFATLAITAALEISHNPHGPLVSALLLYGAVFPALLWYWRKSETADEAPLFLPDLRLPAIVVFALITGTIGFTYDHGHTLPDESSYRFQARIFAAGEWKAQPMPGAAATAPETPPEIYFEHQAHTQRGWFSKYPPGWPLALAVGYLAGFPWAMNPLFGVILLLLVNTLARPWGRETQNLAVIFTALSASSMLYSTGFLSHAFMAVAGMGALAAAFQGVRTERMRDIALCFLLVAIGTEIRPLTGVVVAASCAGYVLYALWGKWRLFGISFATVVVAGAASAAMVLALNRLYTGSALISPYAYSRGVSKVPELTLNPSLIAHNVASVWRWSVTDTLCFTFPFLFPAAIYACKIERRFRRELITLALLFPLLMAAYLFQSESSSSFDGERYYYEGFAALCIVAARGSLLLISRWRIRKQAVSRGLLALGAIHVLFILVMVRDVEARLAPWRIAYRASVAAPRPALVFLGGSQAAFASKHANWNEARWETEHTIFLNDPGVARRDAVACRFQRRSYRVVTYDVAAQRVFTYDGAARCGDAGR